MVPSARAACANLVIFRGRIGAEAVGIEEDGGLIDRDAWKTRPLGY